MRDVPVEWLSIALPEPEYHEESIVRFQWRDVAWKMGLFGKHSLDRSNWDWGLKCINLMLRVFVSYHEDESTEGEVNN